MSNIQPLDLDVGLSFGEKCSQNLYVPIVYYEMNNSFCRADYSTDYNRIFRCAEEGQNTLKVKRCMYIDILHKSIYILPRSTRKKDKY